MGEAEYVTRDREHPRVRGVGCGVRGTRQAGPGGVWGTRWHQERRSEAGRPTARPNRCTQWRQFSCIRASGDLVSEHSPFSPGLPFGVGLRGHPGEVWVISRSLFSSSLSVVCGCGPCALQVEGSGSSGWCGWPAGGSGGRARSSASTLCAKEQSPRAEAVVGRGSSQDQRKWPVSPPLRTSGPRLPAPWGLLRWLSTSERGVSPCLGGAAPAGHCPLQSEAWGCWGASCGPVAHERGQPDAAPSGRCSRADPAALQAAGCPATQVWLSGGQDGVEAFRLLRRLPSLTKVTPYKDVRCWESTHTSPRAAAASIGSHPARDSPEGDR